MSDADLDGRATLVMEDEPAPGVEVRGPGRPLPRLGLDSALPVRSQSASSLLVALLVTAVSLGAAGIAAERSMRWSAAPADEHAHETERLQFFQLPTPVQPAPGAGSVASSRELERQAAAAPRTPTRAAGDTLGAEGAAPSPTGTGREIPIGRAPAGALPSPTRLGEAIGGAVGSGRGSVCAAPCRSAGAVGYAPGTELQMRDSLLREQMQTVVERAGPPVKPPGFQVGLPGGGPTKEERQRDSTLHAEYRKRLERLLARYDSLKADSIARGLIREPPPR